MKRVALAALLLLSFAPVTAHISTTPVFPGNKTHNIYGRSTRAGSYERILELLFEAKGAVAASAQRPAATAAQDWPTYDHDLAGTRFSPLTEISAGNVAKLEKAWTFNFPRPPGGRG